MNLSSLKGFLRVQLLLLSLVWLIIPAARAQGQSVELPTNFIGNRIFLQPLTEQGDTLNLLADTGGALVLAKDVATRLKLPLERAELENRIARLSPLPDFQPRSSIPSAPLKKASGDASSIQEGFDMLKGRMPVRTLPDKYSGDGILGQNWFATRVWTLDYPGQKMILHTSIEEREGLAGHRRRIYFKEDAEGRHELHFPRVQAVIEGDTLNFLLHTGATLVLKDIVNQALDDGLPQARGASFITRSQFEEWYFSHPEWKIYEDVEKGRSSNMIRVPEVTIAGHTVGPVWFTTRPDKMLHKEVSQLADRKIDGVLGGSFLKYFRVTLNYPEEYAVFELNAEQ